MILQPIINLVAVAILAPRQLGSPIHLRPGRLLPVSELQELGLNGTINVDHQAATAIFDSRSVVQFTPLVPTIQLSASSRPQTPSNHAQSVINLCTPLRKVLLKTELIDLSLSPLRPSVKRKHVPNSPRIKHENSVIDLCSPPRSKAKSEPKKETLGSRRSVVAAPGAIVEGACYETVDTTIDAIFYHQEQRGYKWALSQLVNDKNGILKKRTVRCNHYRAAGPSKHLLHLDPSDHRNGKSVRTECYAHININRSAEPGLWRLTTVDLKHNHDRLIAEGGLASRPSTQAHRDVVEKFAHQSSRGHIAKILKSHFPDGRDLEDRQVSNILNDARRDARDKVTALGGDAAAI
ncbi:hypothetical protein C8R44DRAFT_924518, partial [Mycena epipterygia]